MTGKAEVILKLALMGAMPRGIAPGAPGTAPGRGSVNCGFSPALTRWANEFRPFGLDRVMRQSADL